MAITYIGGASGVTTATLPAHEAGDLILAFAYRDGSTTPPTIPAGWDSRGTGGASSNSAVIASLVAAAPGTAAGTWTNATSVVFMVYRGDGPLSVGTVGQFGSTTTTISYPKITLQGADRPSWVTAFAGIRITGTSLETAPSGMVNRVNVVDTVDEASGHDSNGPVATAEWSAPAVSIGSAGGSTAAWRAFTVEICESFPDIAAVGSDDFRDGALTGWGQRLRSNSGVTPTISSANDGTDWWAQIDVPAGGVFDSWTGVDEMPRVVRDASGLGMDWSVTVKFLTEVDTTDTQSQGIWIGGTAGNWMRFEQLGRAGRRDLFCGRSVKGTPVQSFAVTSAGAGARWLRVTRLDGTLTFYSSTDGSSWTLRGTDTTYLATGQVNTIGIHGGRTGSAGAFSIKADWFELSSDPITAEDGATSGGVTASASGTLPLSGAAAGTVGIAALGSGALPLTGVAQASAAVRGTGAGAISLSGAAQAAVAVKGEAVGLLPLSGAAAATVGIVALGSGALPLTGVAQASVAARATGAGAISLSGAAQAAVAVKGMAAGLLPLSGAAEGQTGAVSSGITGAASGSIALAGSAQTSVGIRATAAGVLPLAGAAVAAVSVRGSAAGALAIIGSGTGEVVIGAVGVGAFAITGAASANVLIFGEAIGQIALFGAGVAFAGQIGKRRAALDGGNAGALGASRRDGVAGPSIRQGAGNAGQRGGVAAGSIRSGSIIGDSV